MASIASPLRFPGLARIAAGGWFIAGGVATLRQYEDLLPQAERLFNGTMGKTDAPIRSLVALVLAVALVAIGPVLIVTGFRWMRRLALPPEGPTAIDRDEAIATLVRREPPAFGEGPVAPYWLLRRLLPDQLSDLTWWRRDLMGRGMRAFMRACGLAIVLGALYFVLPYLTWMELLGPFPTGFVLVLLFVTGTWAALGLMLIPPDGPRIESFEFPLPKAGANPDRGPVIETPPELQERESSGLGITMGIFGAAVQCLTVSWWTLSFRGYPLIATSIVRHTGSIAGGIVFLALGERMLRSAAEMLMVFRYASTLVLVEERSGHGATVRTEARGLGGSRHVVSAAVSPQVREEVQRLVESGAGPHRS